MFSPFIIFGINNANVQIFPILGLSIFTTIFVIKTSPFKSGLKNFTLIANSLCYTFILLFFFWIHNYSEGMTQKNRYDKLGSPCIFFICMLLFINVTVGFITIFKTTREVCLKKVNQIKPLLSGINIQIRKKALERQIQMEVCMNKKRVQKSHQLQKKQEMDNSVLRALNFQCEKDKNLQEAEENKIEKNNISEAQKTKSQTFDDLKRFGKSINLKKSMRRVYIKRMNKM